MLFNTYLFIFAFLPLTLIGYYALSGLGQRVAYTWLVVASLFFYGWWNVSYLVLILTSIGINYCLGYYITVHLQNKDRYKKYAFIFGVFFNLSLLGYFKYSGMAIDIINHLFAANLSLGTVVLPLAISFFTFQQISFLADSYSGIAREYRFINYMLFVTFFPQLIAGPIVHHKEMMPQFESPDSQKFKSNNLAIGVMIFSIGLFKKVMLADELGRFATPVFNAASGGEIIGFYSAWVGVLSYGFQIYFDFSGYSDMAIGLARMFGIRLPLNFFSPYKAVNVIEFWQRWHITLSRFLHDYLFWPLFYLPLGISRRHPLRRHINLMVTMLLGGLWHGAGFQFVIWGGLHGSYLVINHFWHDLKSRIWGSNLPKFPGTRLMGTAITFISVMVAWVFFRAENVDSAFRILMGLSGANGYQLPITWVPLLGNSFSDSHFESLAVFDGVMEIILLGISMLIVWSLPNTCEVMSRYDPVVGSVPETRRKRFVFCWQPNLIWGMVCGILLVCSLIFMDKVTEFLYYQF